MKFLELNGIIWVLTKCGNLEWTDAPYNPRASLLTEPIRLEPGKSLALTLAMADARTAEIKSVRLIGLGEKFSAALVEAAERLRNTPMDFRETQKSIDDTMMKYKTRDLVNMAAYRFRPREDV